LVEPALNVGVAPRRDRAPGASTKDAGLKKSPGIFLHSRTVRDGEPIVAILAASPVIDAGQSF
jgi:hypothetical protein